MESCLELIFELLVSGLLELVFDLLASISFDRPTTAPAPRSTPPGSSASGPFPVFAKAVLAGLAGVLFGWLSTLVLRRPLLPWPAARVAFVVVQPVLVATLIGWIDDRRVAAGKRRGVFGDWWTAWAFAFAFALARYVGTR